MIQLGPGPSNKKNSQDARRGGGKESLILVSSESRINIVKMAILPNTIYRSNTMPIKISAKFFTDIKRAVLNFIWRSKNSS